MRCFGGVHWDGCAGDGGGHAMILCSCVGHGRGGKGSGAQAQWERRAQQWVHARWVKARCCGLLWSGACHAREAMLLCGCLDSSKRAACC